MMLVQQRDQAAFGRLLSSHLQSVHRYLTRLTGSSADADELAQETFLKVWQRASTYRRGTVRFTTWLHRIGHNLAVDQLRRRRAESPEAPEVRADEAANPESLALAGEAAMRLDAAISRLPATQRAALLLCQVQGFSTREAATIMHVSARSLESLVARARRSLRAAIHDDEDAMPATQSDQS